MTKIFYYYEGGLGDVILSNKLHGTLAGLKEYKGRNECYVRVVLNVHNFQAAELFRFVKEVDEIQTVPYDPKLRDVLMEGCRREGFSHALGQIRFGDSPANFDVSEEDQRYLDRVLPTGPFIVTHVKAGKSTHDITDMVDLSQVAACAKAKWMSVVNVGGTHFRAVFDKHLLPEGPTNETGVIDLTGLANPRLVCEIIRRSAGFVGTLSCYIWAAVHHDRPRLVVLPDGLDDDHCRLVNDGTTVVMRMSELGPYTDFVHRLFDK